MMHGGMVTLLHLSDLHFGRHHRFASDDGPNSLLERLRLDLDGLREKESVKPDLVIVSGDLAEYGKKTEFEQAFLFLQKLGQTLELAPSRFVIVPGNHDINRKLCTSYFEECAGNDETPVRPYFKKLEPYRASFAKFYAGQKGITFTEDEPWSFFEYPDLGVVVAGLNSVFAESHDDHFAFLGEKQLRAFAGKLRPYKDKGFLRVGVMHHNPRDRRGGEETKEDQDQLRRLLAPSLNLVLHGDVHEETEDALLAKVPVLGIGSLGAALNQRPEEVPNEYQVLQIAADGIRRFLQIYAPDQRRFLPSARADAAGTSSVVEIAVTFEHVHALGQTKPATPETDLDDLVDQYRRAMEKDQRMRTVSDLLIRDALNVPMTALDVLRLFVPQNVMREEPSRHSRRERERQGRAWDEPGVEPEKRNESFDEWEAMDSFPMGGYADTVAGALAKGWVYLLGAPGAGKTALTRWILLSLCVPGERIEGFSEELVPVRVDMRLFHVAREKAGSGFSIFEYLDQEHGDRFLKLRGDPLRELARRGRLYFIFDGLDEVIDESKRHTYAEMIAGLARSEEYARCRGVVTSRIVGAHVAQALFDGSGFSTYTLRDFAESQQERYWDTLHALMFEHEPEMRAHRRTRLNRAVEASPSLRALCGNPMCCSLLAYLNRDEELPEGRHHLYQRILERLAEHWDANKDLPVRNGSLKFDLPDKLSFLRRLGLNMMEAGGGEAGNAIATENLVRFAQSFCEERWSEPPDAARRRAEALIANLRERNEVLVWLGGDVFGFSHRAFLEYSAAARMIEQHGRREGISQLASWFQRHWRDEDWEETLLLACGRLREVDQGPALVVQVLQEMSGGDRAAVYRELDAYLCFCIKALGELRSLEHGVVRQFADEINGVLEFQIQCETPKIWGHELLAPFRRAAGKWPDVERLMHETVKRNQHFLDDLFPVWIAAAGRSDRLDLLLHAIRAYQEGGRERFGVPWALSKEASRLGPWSSDEIARICATAETVADDNSRYNVLADIVHAPGMSFGNDDRIIHDLVHMMKHSADEHVQQTSAWTLIHANCHVEQAFSRLREFLTNEKEYYRHNAARILCRLGSIDDALPHLAESAENHWDSLGLLIDIARNHANAMTKLREIVPRLRRHADMKMVVWSFKIGVGKGYEVIPHREMTQRLREQDEEHAERYLDLLAHEKRLTQFVAAEYEWRLPRIHQLGIFDMAARDALRLEPKYGGEPLRRVWAMLLHARHEGTVINAARRLLRQSHYPELIEAARTLMRNRSTIENPERIRYHSAGALGLQDPVARGVFETLAAMAVDEWTRYDAARAIGNVRVIAALEERAQNLHVKDSAREAQTLYTHIHDLLHVGRPRKALVKLHNEHIGVLQETTSRGGTKFTYDKPYLEKPGARPLAPNLPLRTEAYEHRTTLHPFFANLLPEGTILEQTARRLGLPKDDRFGILLKVGEDVMGAVQVLPEEDP